MKKIILNLSLITLLAAGCNSNKSVSTNTQPAVPTQQEQTQQSQPTSPDTNIQTPTPSAPVVSDLDKLISAAAYCTPTLGHLKLSQSLFSSITYIVQDSEIKGYQGQYCNFVNTRTDMYAVFDEQLYRQTAKAFAPDETLSADDIANAKAKVESQNVQLKANNVGLIQNCLFTSGQLLFLLNSYKSDLGSLPEDQQKKLGDIQTAYCKNTLPNSNR